MTEADGRAVGTMGCAIHAGPLPALSHYLARRTDDVPAALVTLRDAVAAEGASAIVSAGLAAQAGLGPCPFNAVLMVACRQSSLEATILGNGWSVVIQSEIISVDVPGASDVWAISRLSRRLDELADIAFLPNELVIEDYEMHSAFVRFICAAPR